MSRQGRASDALAAAELVPVPEFRRWQKVTQVILVVLMIGSTVGVLGLVVRNSVWAGRMTADVSIAQQRTTNLHNLQISALQLRESLIELDSADDAETVQVRRGLFGRMVTVVYKLFPESSREARELKSIKTAVDRFAWDRLAGPDHGGAALRQAGKALAAQAAVQVKSLYDAQEKYFYDAARASLAAKGDSERALVALVSLVVIMAAGWLVLLRRRARNRLGSAYAALLSEVAERRTLQDQLSHQAYHDALTGLPNRTMFLRRLTDAIQAFEDTKVRPAVVLVDLDGFKKVNDTLGHAAGDRLLQQVAGRLRDCVRADDLVARLGGDEFAIVVPEDAGQDADAVSRRLVDVLGTPVTLAGQEVSISASIGIARLDGQAAADDLLADADIAMYEAKKAGKARYEVFRSDLRNEALRRVRWEQELARAVTNREIEVFYQPILDLRTDRIVSVEALARWRHPEHGLVAPAVFVPIAEESGLIREIGRDVLRQACATVQQWRQTVLDSEDLSVAVNVSVRQLISGTFAGHLAEALRDSGLPPAALTLEITESLMLEESQAVTDELTRIKAMGVRLAMDDFGAGYSSVAVLLHLRVDVLKIDKAFLDLDNRETGTLIRAGTELGHTLGLAVVAEGVETGDQLAHVRAARCDYAQGYLLSKPMPPGQARAYLQARQPVPAPSA